MQKIFRVFNRMRWLFLWMAIWGLHSPDVGAAELTVEQAWLRLPPPVSDTAAAYMKIVNPTNGDVELTAITTESADIVMLHHVQLLQGVTRMLHADHVRIPAHEYFLFEPGKSHIMLMGLTHSLQAHDSVYVQLHFSDGSNKGVMLDVRDMRGNVAQNSVNKKMETLMPVMGDMH